jgi:hypothetical protein
VWDWRVGRLRPARQRVEVVLICDKSLLRHSKERRRMGRRVEHPRADCRRRGGHDMEGDDDRRRRGKVGGQRRGKAEGYSRDSSHPSYALASNALPWRPCRR